MSNIRYEPRQILKFDFHKLNTVKHQLPKDLIMQKHLFLVLGAYLSHLTLLIISSQNDKVCSKYPYNVEIKDWKQAGLHKPSHVKGDLFFNTRSDCIYEVIGKITPTDYQRILDGIQNISNKDIVFVEQLQERGNR